MTSREHDAARGSSPDALTDRSARVVAAHKLLRRARRTESGCPSMVSIRACRADGAQAAREAVAAERRVRGTVRELYVTAEAAARQVTIVRAALDLGITVTEVTARAATKLSDAVTPQGITARCALPAAYTDGRYLSFPDAPPPLEDTGGPQVKDISGSVLPGLSKWAMSAGGS